LRALVGDDCGKNERLFPCAQVVALILDVQGSFLDRITRLDHDLHDNPEKSCKSCQTIIPALRRRVAISTPSPT
jgi:hypothetical protein